MFQGKVTRRVIPDTWIKQSAKSSLFGSHMSIISSNTSSTSSFKRYGLIEQISDTLTDFVLKGELKGGEQLKEDDLKQYFQVSRSPIREALRKLEKRGLVSILPRRGTFVKKVTLQDIEHNFKARSVLEGLAAREAHSRMSEKDLDTLKLNFMEMKQAVAQKDKDKFMERITRFHKIFITCANNKAIISCLKNLPVHITWNRFMAAYTQKEMERSIQNHEEMLKQFQNRDSDPKKIEALVREHLETSVDRLGRYLEKEQMLDP